MKYLTAADILKQQGVRQAKRYEAFEIILENVYKKIQKCIQVTRNVFSCFFEVPEFLIGYPLYDLNECIQYIVKILVTKGFAIQYIFPRILFVSWMPKANATLPMPMSMSMQDEQTNCKQPVKNNRNVNVKQPRQQAQQAQRAKPSQQSLQSLQSQQSQQFQQSLQPPHMQIQHDDGKKVFIQKSSLGKKMGGKFVLDLS
jgi:hypothetical protein